MTEKRQPWGKWYWGDWRKDARLRRCSYAARGLWADMLSLMGGECERFGALIMDRQPLGPGDLVSMLGGSEREVTKMLGELEAKRVFNRVGDDDVPEDVAAIIGDSLPPGTIISRRMVRDKAKADQDRENGKGGGNPGLKPPPKPSGGGDDNGGVNPSDKAQNLEARRDSPERKKESSEAKASGAGAPSPEVEVFRRGKLIFGERGGGMVTKIRKLSPGNDEQVLALFDVAETKQDPAEWLAAVVKRGSMPVDDFGRVIGKPYDAMDDYQRMAVRI